MSERLKQVEEIIASEFNVPTNFREDMSRTDKIIFPKKLLCSILYDKEGMKLEAVAFYMGYKEHSNIIHHMKTGKVLYACDDSYRIKVDNVYKKISNIYTINTNE